MNHFSPSSSKNGLNGQLWRFAAVLYFWENCDCEEFGLFTIIIVIIGLIEKTIVRLMMMEISLKLHNIKHYK